MIYNIFIWKTFLFQLQQYIKYWAKPATLSLVLGVLSDLTRSRADLVLENALLRQQLILLNRQVKRPLLTHRDRFRLVLLARCTRFWKQALLIVQPETLLRWHWKLDGPHSSYAKQHPGVKARNISSTNRPANMPRIFRLWPRVHISKG